MQCISFSHSLKHRAYQVSQTPGSVFWTKAMLPTDRQTDTADYT